MKRRTGDGLGTEQRLRLRSDGLWRELTAREVDGASRQIAAQLAEIGITRGSTVAVVCDERFELLICELAVRSLGAQSLVITPATPISEAECLLTAACPAASICQFEEQAKIVHALVGGAILVVAAPEEERVAPGFIDLLGFDAATGRALPSRSHDAARAEPLEASSGVASEGGNGRVVAITGEVARAATRQIMYDALTSGASVTVVPRGEEISSFASVRPHAMIADDGTLVARIVTRVEALAPPRVQPGVTSGALLSALGPAGWGLAAIIGVGSPSSRAVIAMGVTLAVLVAVGLLARRMSAGYRMAAAAAALALLLRAVDRAPSFMAAAELAVVIATTSAAASAALRYVAGVAWSSAVDGRGAPSRTRGLCRSLSTSAVERASRRAVGLTRCTEVRVVGYTDPSFVRRFSALFPSIRLEVVPAPGSLSSESQNAFDVEPPKEVLRR